MFDDMGDENARKGNGDWLDREKKFHQDRILRKIQKVTMEFAHQEHALVSRLRELGSLKSLLTKEGGIETYLTPDIDDALRKLSVDIDRSKGVALALGTDDDIDDDLLAFKTRGADEEEEEEDECANWEGLGETQGGDMFFDPIAAEEKRKKAKLAAKKLKEKQEKEKKDVEEIPNVKVPKFFYKEAAVVGNKYYSIADGKTEFKGGRILAKSRPKKDLIEFDPREHLDLLPHLIFDSEEKARVQLFPANSKLMKTPRVVLKCAAAGRYHWYEDMGAFWFEKIKPLALKRWYTEPKI